MGIIRAFTGAISGTFADQWRDLFTAEHFDEFTIVTPGVLKQPDGRRGTTNRATDGVISNGSKIFVPENTAAFIFSQAGIEDIITEPGGYEYQDGKASVFSGGSIMDSFVRDIGDRIGYGGQTDMYKKIAFVNLREMRGLKFGTRGPLLYHDLYYGVDLTLTAFGAFSIKITDATTFIRKYIPPNTDYYSFHDTNARSQILSEFLQSFTVAVNALSKTHRISELPSQAEEISRIISNENSNTESWKDRFGLEVVQVGIENIELSPESKELVNQYATQKMDWKVLDNVTQQTSNVAAQQKIAQGVENHGFGDMGGMMFGLGMVQGLNPQTGAQTGVHAQMPTQQPMQQPSQQPLQQPQPQTVATMSIDEQIESLKKLKDLVDAGILTQDEFDIKKKELLGL